MLLAGDAGTCPGCLRVVPGGAAACEACGAELPERLPASGRRSAQRRRLTVLMTDLCGYTELTESLDPEDVAVILRAFRRHAGVVVEKYGGMVNQFVGDEVVALFGLTTSSEDEPARAVKAALELHRTVLSLETESRRLLRVHTGIDCGLVFLDNHDHRGGVWEVTGDPINLAARLRSKAAPDEIVISDTVQEAAAAFIVAEELAPFDLKGKAAPSRAFRVLGTRRTRSGFEARQNRPLGAFIGRTAELRQLQSAFERTRSGAAELVIVHGELGVGKTRLVDEFTRGLPSSVLVLRGECSPYGTGPLYEPFAALIREAVAGAATPPDAVRDDWIAAELSTRYPELAESVPALLHVCSLERRHDRQLDGERWHQHLAKALYRLLKCVAQHSPAVVVLEHWQWADDVVRSILRHLAARLHDARLLLIVNQRLMPDALPGAAHLELAAFDEALTASMIEALLGAAELSPDAAARVHHRSAGNPLFIEELCHSLLDQGLPRDGSPLEIPARFQAVLRSRLDGLSHREAEVLHRASAFTRDFSADLLAPLLDETGPLEPTLERLRHAELLQSVAVAPTARYRFKHHAMREVAYDALSARLRRSLHARIARAIEAELAAGRSTLHEQLEVLADHFSASRSHSRAAHYSELAGDRAAADHAYERARLQYRRAIEHLDADDPQPDVERRRIEVSLKWAAVCIHDPAALQLDVLSASRELSQDMGDEHGTASTLCWMGRLESVLGNQQRALAHFQQALTRANGLRDDDLVAELHLDTGKACALATDYAGALRSLARGEALERALLERGPEAANARRRCCLADGFGYVAVIHADVGDFARAHARIREAMALVHAGGPLSLEGAVTTQLAIVQLCQGDFAACLETAARIGEIARHIDAPHLYAMSQTASGYSKALLGDPGGIAELRDAVRRLEQTEIRLSASWNLACLAEVLALHGDVAEARDVAHRAVARARSGDRLGEAAAHRALGLAAHRAGEASVDHFQTSLDRAFAKGSSREAALTYLRWAETLDTPLLAGQLNHQALETFVASRMRFYVNLTRSRITAAEQQPSLARVVEITEGPSGISLK